MTAGTGRIYLDNAATSFPKPPGVYEAVRKVLCENGAAYGRGASRAALETQRVVERCRERLGRIFAAPSPQHVVFTFNGTDSLNLAIHGLAKEGDHVVTTAWEHNSVLRPLKQLASTKNVSTSIVPGFPTGELDMDRFEQLIRQSPQLVILNHVSNVTGMIQPVELLIPLARKAGCTVIVDAAQSAGHIPVDHLLTLGAQAVACPGHKGLLGPLGTGVLILAEGMDTRVEPHRQGGTGTTSESDSQPGTLPDRYESGNHNVPGLWGLEAGIAWIEERGFSALRTEEVDRMQQLLDGLAACPGVAVIGSLDAKRRAGVVSCQVRELEPHVVGSILDQHFQIEVRAGLHCAPLAHEALGTLEHGGTVRLSIGHFTSRTEIDKALEAMAQISAAT